MKAMKMNLFVALLVVMMVAFSGIQQVAAAAVPAPSPTSDACTEFTAVCKAAAFSLLVPVVRSMWRTDPSWMDSEIQSAVKVVDLLGGSVIQVGFRCMREPVHSSKHSFHFLFQFFAEFNGSELVARVLASTAATENAGTAES